MGPYVKVDISTHPDLRVIIPTICNLYSRTNTQDAMPALFRIVDERAGKLPPMPGNFRTTGRRSSG
jgi:hypothetical protein